MKTVRKKMRLCFLLSLLAFAFSSAIELRASVIIIDPGGGNSNLSDPIFTNDPPLVSSSGVSGAIHSTAGMLDGQQQDLFNHSIALRVARFGTDDGDSKYAEAKPVELASTGSLPPASYTQTDNPWDFWAQGVGDFGDLDGNGTGGDFTISGFSGGLDYRVSKKFLLGVAVGYSRDDIDLDMHNSTAKVDDFSFGTYAAYVSGPWHFDGIVSYGVLNTDTKRTFAIDNTLFPTAKANYLGGIVSLSAEGGYDFQLCKRITFQPSLGIIYNHLSQDSFKEKDAGPDGLEVKSISMDSFRTDLGAKLTGDFGKPNGVRFLPQFRASWQHEFADQTAFVDEQFLGDTTDSSFTVHGVKLGAENAVVGAGLTVAFNKAIQCFFDYDARLNERLTSQTISGGISVGW
jgi:outer membrane autotransporter protein